MGAEPHGVPGGQDADPAPAPAPASALELVDEWDAELSSADPLRFPGYRPPAATAESVRTGLARLGELPVALVECRFEHHGGTMGAVAGERIVRAFARATDRRLPVVELVSSGGARLQEGMLSLVQMARTASAAGGHARAGLLTAAVLRGAVTGGVYASWASLAQVRAAEPGAVLGFGGPRVVAEVTGHWPPADSHTAESAFRAGLVDALVPRPAALPWLGGVVGAWPAPPLALPAGRPDRLPSGPPPAREWDLLARARAPDRPSGLEWAAWLTDSWVELHGRDPAIRAGLATVGGGRVVVVAMDRHVRGDAAARPGPDAYRLAQRAIRLADRLGLPVLTLIDTPGADPAPDAERHGVAAELAGTLLALAELRTPSVALCVGEGASGGAMALGHADRLLVLAGAVFSVIGPAAGAAILYRDPTRAPELARDLQLTAPSLLRLAVVDEIVPERVPAVAAAVAAALATAEVGARLTRPDQATQRALRPRRVDLVRPDHLEPSKEMS